MSYAGREIEVRLVAEPKRGPVATSGPLRSVQEAEITMDRSRLEEFWRAETLERFARGYWRYVSRISLGLLRIVDDGDSGPAVVLLWRRLVLLRFRRPSFNRDADHGRVTWAIDRGVLVAREGRGHGFLAFDLQRLDTDEREGRIRVRAEVENFYPLLRGSGRFARIGAWIYARTQLRLHVWVTRGFLRSLDSGELPAL